MSTVLISPVVQAGWLLLLISVVVYAVVAPNRHEANRVSPGDILGFTLLVGIPLATMRLLN